MKKIILLILILPLSLLMAIDFTMTKDGLYPDTTIEQVQTEPTSTLNTIIQNDTSTSKYLEPVNLPECDANNPEVQFIKIDADWSTINSASKRIFCVSPGDYTSLKNIKLTASGTAEKRRYIVLNNGNDTHPGKLNKSQLANLALDLEGASYWIFDRIASFDVDFTHSFILGSGSTHNVFNRMFTQNLFHTMWIRDKAHYNTIQNSRFDGITKSGAEADLSTINIAEWGDSVKYFTVFGTKIINNEFVNTKAARCNRFPAEHLPSGVSQVAYFNGTIFDSNTVETTIAMRTDCNGNFNPSGECVGLESGGIGFKGGSNDVNKPIIVSNNHAWGHRRTDPTYTYLSGTGNFSLTYLGAENIIYDNNVVFDGTGGIAFADRYDAPYGSKNIVMKNNLLYNLGIGRIGIPLIASQGVDNRVEHNTIINSRVDWANIWVNDNLYFGNNTVINPAGTDVLKIGYIPKGFDTNIVYNTSEEAGYTKDYSFTADKFTNNPRVITLPNAVKAN